MVETSKQVRVDNWGIYFLQRLQLFFSKTDYCDLTLQFEGNVQLKVHRLVMNACTEYFSYLEQTYPAIEDNTILMPSDLQADVIVPIVNFMYTGMLEFHPSIFDKLYRAAEIMNITVLTKLLEAQLSSLGKMGVKMKKDTIEFRKEVKKVVRPPALSPVANDLPVKKTGPIWKKRSSNPAALQSHPASATFSNKWNSDPIERDPLSFPDNAPKPTRFEWPEEDLTPISLYPSFDDVSLTSKPLWTKADDQKAVIPAEESHYLNQSKSTSSSPDYDNEIVEKNMKTPQIEDTPLTNDNSSKRKPDLKTGLPSPKRIKITNQEEETVISITSSNPSEVDHTKIVSEVLKKYPDLVKKNKNIKLKITQARPDTTPQIKVQTVKENPPLKPVRPPVTDSNVLQISPKEIKKELSPPQQPALKEQNKTKRTKSNSNPNFRAASEEGPWTCLECLAQDREGAEFVLYYLFRKHMADQHQMEFDSSLCKYCGKKCPKDNLMTYHLYTKHGLKPPKDTIFPTCDKCPFIAVTNERLHEHMKIHSPDEVQCASCQLGFLGKKELMGHIQIAGHNNKKSSILDCAYCMKKLQNPVTLFTHVRIQHPKEARRDGISSLDEIMDVQEEELEENSVENSQIDHEENQKESHNQEKQPSGKEQIKIISNVKATARLKNHNESKKDLTEISSDSVTVSGGASATNLSNIGSSLATNLGLVDIVVLDDNHQYILQQPQDQTGNTEFILPPELAGSEGILQAAAASGELNSTDELVMVLTDQDYQDEQAQSQADNSNIVVLYSHPVEGQQGQFITSQGNLLVNSDGMLEIRDGATITTTAGQILVNNGNTTTTQATDSPIESIDLIRKEIESSVMDSKGGTDLNAVLEQPVAQNEVKTEEKSLKHENAKDTTDSASSEEQMDVDEMETQPQQPENASEEIHLGSNLQEDLKHEILEDSKQPNQNECEENNDETNHLGEKDETSDISNILILNDPRQYQQDPPPEEECKLEEPMEIDGAEIEPPSVDEVDQNECSGEPAETSAKSIVSSEAVVEANLNKPSTGDHHEVVTVNDSNDNVREEDFTDESQQSEKGQKDLNKEILDDWEDTDSQQSQSHVEQVEGEAEKDSVTNATENVTKLMDDWDEEDEDQAKE
ncbi:hypothetical protein ABEB36_004922 [Hypothenemus hampei]|uniref:BTB domain-containing protein n=1 Tax=Hypothenemus hampei TaxID=57062 RepID=A0ABD1EWB7_HYPHA